MASSFERLSHRVRVRVRVGFIAPNTRPAEGAKGRCAVLPLGGEQKVKMTWNLFFFATKTSDLVTDSAESFMVLPVKNLSNSDKVCRP